MRFRRVVLLALSVAGGCKLEVDLSGKRCPCVADFECDVTRDRCVPAGTLADSADGGDGGPPPTEDAEPSDSGAPLPDAEPFDADPGDAAPLDAAPGDAAPQDAGPIEVDVAGERVVLSPGWSAEVWFDFSDQFGYREIAYNDENVTLYSNTPQSMVLLAPPFSPGIGLVTVHDLIELREPDSYTEHYFFRAVSVSAGPDVLGDAASCNGWMTVVEGLCISAGSQGGGDGIFLIRPDWSITRISYYNNVNHLGVDASGAFDALGVPEVYFGAPNGFFRFNEDGVHTMIGPNEARTPVVLADGRMAAVSSTIGAEQLVLFQPTTHAATVLWTETLPAIPINGQNPGAITLVTGDLSWTSSLLFALLESNRLAEFAPDGTRAIVAKTVDPNWRWAAGLLVGEDHPLGADGPRFYVVEHNRASNLDRIIRLRPPP